MSYDNFGANTADLSETHLRMQKLADEFKHEYEEMFVVVDALVGSEWSSPAATMVRNSIIGETANLEAMYQALCGYAEFCKIAAIKVEDNEESIIAGVGGEYNG